MKNFSRIVSLSCLFVLGSLSALYAFDPDELNTVTVVNKTGKEGYYLYVSPGDAEVWGADLLDAYTSLENGDEHRFMIHYPDTTNNFDFMLVAEDGSSFTKWDVPITDGEPVKIVFTVKDKSGDKDMPNVEITLRNKTGFELYNIFFSPEESDMWGPDILRADVTLEDGDTYSFNVPVSSQKKYNVMVIDEDYDTYRFNVVLKPDSPATYSVTIDDLD
jgi:hypothetical protein